MADFQHRIYCPNCETNVKHKFSHDLKKGYVAECIKCERTINTRDNPKEIAVDLVGEVQEAREEIEKDEQLQLRKKIIAKRSAK